ncbi:MAG: T9SS type A sorting domain-containing protein [Flavobacteriales bacterium]
MKKILLCLFTAVAALFSQAQIVTLDAPIEVLYGTASMEDEELHGEITVTNNTASTMSLRCTSTLVMLTEGHKYQYCWGQTCSPFTTNSYALNDVVTLGAGQSTETFYFKLRHYGNAGQSKVCFNWFDNNNPDVVVTTCVNFCVDADCNLSASEIKATANISAISPNPVTKTAVVSYDFATRPSNGKIKIHNLVGAIMKEVDLSQASGGLIIEAADFENGIYFISIENEGRVFETKRLVIAK